MSDYQCRVCQSPNVKVLPRETYYVGKPAGIWLWRCEECGTVGSSDPGHSYDDDYYNSYDDCIPGTVYYEQRKALFRHRCEMLAREVGVGLILDIGCARGDFLNQACELGFSTYGLEVSAAAVVTARVRGHRVVNGLAAELPFAQATFNAVHMNHVLEHVEDPVTCLRSIRRILKPGGLAIIEVPNELGPLAVRIKLLAGQLGTPGTEQIRYGPHLTYFNMRTLRGALQRSGLRIVSQRTRFSGHIIPSFATIPAMIARVYDRLTFGGYVIEVVVAPQ